MNGAGARLEIPFADYWRPTAANYWGRVKKAHGLETAAAILGPRWAADHADDKKPILASALEDAFDPNKNTAVLGLESAARDNAASWLPPGIACERPVTPPPAAAIGEAGASPRPSETFDPGASGEDSENLPAFLMGDVAPNERPNGALHH